MEQNLLIDSGLSFVDEDYELLKALGMIDDEETDIIDGYEADEDDDDDDDDDWDEFETDDDEIYDGLFSPLWRCIGKTSSRPVGSSS